MANEAIVADTQTGLIGEKEFISLIKSKGANYDKDQRWDLPKPEEYEDRFNLSKNGTNPRITRIALDSLINYLRYPIISDEAAHTGENSRSAWRDELYGQIKTELGEEAAEDFNRRIHRNKLRGNAISGASMAMEILCKNDPALRSTAQKALDAVNETLSYEVGGSYQEPGQQVEPWDGPTTPAKLKVVHDLSDGIARVLGYYKK